MLCEVEDTERKIHVKKTSMSLVVIAYLILCEVEDIKRKIYVKKDKHDSGCNNIFDVM